MTSTSQSSMRNSAEAPSPGSESLATISPDQPAWKVVTVEHLDGERYVIGVRGHVLTVDQPLADGGYDTAPTPTELFVASLASCVAFYAGRYLDRHGFGRKGLRVSTSFTMATDRPARIASLNLSVSAPMLPAERRPAFLAVVNKCAVHNTLHQTPAIDITLA